MEPILKIVTTVCMGLMIGTEFAVSAFINPILDQLDNVAQAHATRLFGRKLGTVMPFWYSLCLLLLIAEAITVRQNHEVVYLVAAILIWVFVIVLTLLVLVPINNRIVRMESDVFTDKLDREHRTWDVIHRWRVFALCVAMVCMLIGTRA